MASSTVVERKVSDEILISDLEVVMEVWPEINSAKRAKSRIKELLANNEVLSALVDELQEQVSVLQDEVTYYINN